MPIPNKDSNLNGQKKITIIESKDANISNDPIYGEILNYLIPRITKTILVENEKEFKEISVSFRLRELVNWLIQNDRNFKNEFEGSKLNMSNRAHSKSPMIAKRVDILVQKGILKKIGKKVESKRNKNLTTNLYGITNFGRILALTMQMNNKYLNQSNTYIYSSSEEYKKMLAYLVKQWLTVFPLLRYDYGNCNYYCKFLEELLNDCIDKNDDIILEFLRILPNPFDKQIVSSSYEVKFDLFTLNHFLNPDRGYVFTNFSDFRYKMNYVFFEKIMDENKPIISSLDNNGEAFRTLFYELISNFDKHISYETASKPSISLNTDSPLEKQNLIKFQFKIDIQSEIERRFALYAEHKSFLAMEYQLRKDKGSYSDAKKQVIDLLYNETIDEMHFTYEIKEAWEQLRNEHLSNPDTIVILVKCKNCKKRYPYPFRMEKDLLKEISCTLCNDLGITYYEYPLSIISKTK